MTDRAKQFARICWPVGRSAPPMDSRAAAVRMEAEARTIRRMLDEATPPAMVGPVPVAPARPAQMIVPDFVVQPGGTRRREGGHFVDLCQLEIAVAQAAQRHQLRTPDAAFVPPFTASQIAVARDYRSLVEWREGSGLRCSSLEAGRSGGGSGLFIDTYIRNGEWLAELHQRIGGALALDVRRNMDRGNTRRPISVRQAVDLLVVGGRDLSAILRRFGWQPDGKTRKDLRTAICGALDRMQGYRDA